MPVPKVQFEWGWLGVAECSGEVTIPVDLTTATNVPVTVNCVITDINATNGVDYTITGIPVSFSPGTTQAFIKMQVIKDTVTEGDETLTLTLSDPTNANLGGKTVLKISIRETCSV
jgi:hypothetical protein